MDSCDIDSESKLDMVVSQDDNLSFQPFSPSARKVLACDTMDSVEAFYAQDKTFYSGAPRISPPIVEMRSASNPVSDTRSSPPRSPDRKVWTCATYGDLFSLEGRGQAVGKQ